MATTSGSTKPIKHVALGYEAESTGAPSNTVNNTNNTTAVPFGDVAVLPEAGDNCAIARKVTPGGTTIILPDTLGGGTVTLNHTILEGHRFAIRNIHPGEKLLSWGLVFGEALLPLQPGNYLANERVLNALRGRHITDLPAQPNFLDLIVSYTIDEKTFKPAEQVPLVPKENQAYYDGFSRDPSRGVGTRNYIIVIGTTSMTAAYVKGLELKVKELYPNFNIEQLSKDPC